MDAKGVRLSEVGRDALYELVEDWLSKHLSRAFELRESHVTELVDGIRQIMRSEVALQLTDGPIKAPSGG